MQFGTVKVSSQTNDNACWTVRLPGSLIPALYAGPILRLFDDVPGVQGKVRGRARRPSGLRRAWDPLPALRGSLSLLALPLAFPGPPWNCLPQTTLR